MTKIPEISIVDDTGFFLGKNFSWPSVGDFSVITGINGSGKTKLLEHIENAEQYKSSHLIRYINVDYRPPLQKYVNEIANAYNWSLENVDGKCQAFSKKNNTMRDWTRLCLRII